MEVTVGGMDAAVEPIWIYSRRVTGMTVLNDYIHIDFTTFSVIGTDYADASSARLTNTFRPTLNITPTNRLNRFI